jgi:L-amino acid N-acyltransferase YncA
MVRQDSHSTTVRGVTPADAGAVAAIYNHYVLQTVVTFEEEPVTSDEMSRRIDEVRAASLPWFVAERAGAIAGYAYASRWRARSAYRFSSEVTVYLAREQGRRGIGSALYAELLSALRASGLHAAIGGIALPNDASVALHERFGFKKVAHFEQTGFKFNRWIDVGYWELIL